MSISNRKDNDKSLYLIEKSISDQNVCTGCLYLIEKSI